MDQRLKSLEDLCELITKEIVQQNKNMIEVNKSLLSEIKSLREAYVKQDDDFEEFKNLLRKIYELNRQNSYQNQLPVVFPSGPQQQQQPGQQHLQPPMPNLNNSLMIDQVNQSMLNNLSFQSERTPLNQHNLNPNTSNYSVPSSASAINQQFLPFFNQNLPQPQQPIQQQQQQQQQQKSSLFQAPSSIPSSKPSPAQPLIPPFNPAQPPPPAVVPAPKQTPFSFSNILSNNTKQPEPQQQQQRLPPLINQTTSTPQSNQFSFSKLQQPAVNLATNDSKPKFQFSPSKQAPIVTTTTTPTKPEQASNNLFGPNLFKTTTDSKQPFFSGINIIKAPEPTSLSNILKNNEEDEQEGAGGGANPEDFEPQLDFKPIVKLQEVEVKTGEEDEDVLFKQRCKLFRFVSETKEWKEKGVGELKLLKNRQTQAIRVLMRRDQVLKLCANHRLNPSMTIKEMAPKQLSWLATDFSDNVASTEMLLVKFKTVEEGTQFKQEFEKAVEASKSLPTTSPAVTKTLPTQMSTKPSLSETLKSDKWNCTGCYAPNKKEDIKCMCCGTLKPGATAADVKPATTTAPSGLFSFGTQPTKINESPTKAPFSFGQTASPATSANKPFSFGQPTQPAATASKLTFGAFPTDVAKTQSPAKTANLFGQPPAQQGSPAKSNLFSFGSLATAQATPPPTQPVLFEKSSLPSFASLAAKPDLFGAASPKPAFGGGLQPSVQPPKPLFGGDALSTGFRAPATEDGDENSNDQNPEEYEPQIDFKPLVKLQEVEVKTGEEDEIAVFKQRCKLFRYDSDLKEWKEKGTGEMKILKHKENEGMYRILMRRDQVLKLCANHRITTDLKFEIYNDKQVRWHAQDYTEGEGKHETLAARFKHEDDAKNFVKEAENAQKAIESAGPQQHKPAPKAAAQPATTSNKPNLSDIFKSDKQWKCNACYAPNSNDVIKCACCATLKPGATEPLKSATEQAATVGLSKISFGQQPAQSNILFGSQTNSPAKFEFGSKPFQPLTVTKDEVAKPVFGIKTEPQTSIFSTTTTPSTPVTNADPAVIFGNKSDLSFADLAKKSQPSGFGGGFSAGFNQSPGGLFANLGKQPATVFGAQSKDNEEEAGEDTNNPEEYEPQIDFAPLVKLHEVEVKTGEEDEEILFKQRCKLYRFTTETKEWKEKGVGEIKILKHKLKENSYRVLMRRDQVLKICANHRINPSIKLEVVNEKQLRWFVTDCSEDEPHPELLLAKFRLVDDATKFREEFEKAQQAIAANPNAPSTPQQPAAQSRINNLASSLKTAAGVWSCSACLSQNKAESTSCAACQTARFEDKSDDISVIKELRASQEQVEKAREFGLPDNFYLYENKPECAGCRGCHNEE